MHLIDTAHPLNPMTLVWECNEFADCVIEHHQGCLYLFTDAAKEGVSPDSYYLLRSNVEVMGSRTWEVCIYSPYSKFIFGISIIFIRIFIFLSLFYSQIEADSCISQW